MSGFGFETKAEASVARTRNQEATFKIGGTFQIECFDSEGNLKWSKPAKNGVTNVGLDDVLERYFRAGTTLAEWYIGLITGPGPTLAAGDTHASHAGWTEFTAYSEANRQDWNPDPAASQSVANPSLINFSITGGAATLSGVFVVGGASGAPTNTKGSTDPTPTLWATALFDGGDQAVNGGDVVRVTYTINAASA